ncbi:MAG: U32 family peptidase [Deltaproteobacteria bacterium]|nr:U32 family peptidase [Deltaproteobacteria bacterium]
MKRKIELLAPGGDIDSIKAAIVAGADAIYCGLDKFNARNRAENITFEDLNGILRLAHKNNCEVFLTLNIIITESEIPALIRLLNKLVNTSIDGVIVQDLGMFYLLSNYFKGLKIHASTQLTTHNEGQIHFLHKLNATRVNLSRELNINEVKALAVVGHKSNILTEIFVHGSYCISFSGLCYISSLHGGNSGNRGRCSQPCRDEYITTPQGKNFPLNLKDNSAWFDLREIYDARVDSIKIEGRIKSFDYVYTVVNSWRKQIASFYNQYRLKSDNSDLYKVFNRDFSNAFMKGDINKDMFIDYPRDHSIKQYSELNIDSSNDKLIKEKKEFYDKKEEIIWTVKGKIKDLSIEKSPLIINISGKEDRPLKVSVKTTDSTFDVLSETHLKKAAHETLNKDFLLQRLKAVNDSSYYIKALELEALEDDLFIPFKELTLIKKRILYILNGSREFVDPIEVPLIKKQNNVKIKPTLSVLISSQKDLYLCNASSANIYFQLPDCIENEVPEFIELFRKNKKLIPWFPSVLIGESYAAAVEFLRQLQPKLIVTNNTGIAYEAGKNGIPWIAGPYLNIVNSFSLLCLKEKFNCHGSFISNELKKIQIKNIKRPDDFELYYSIYHPIVLMTSRQCFFHQVTGCEKDRIDDNCIPECNKSALITNVKKVSFLIEKRSGSYNCLYNEKNYLNTDIISDLPDLFSGFFIDLRDIKTGTEIDMDKRGIIKLFENCLNGNSESIKELNQIIHPTTKAQYKKGI